MAATFQSMSRREGAPVSHRVWKDENEDKLSSLEHDFADWMTSLQKGEVLFKKHVYDNPEADAYDFRQHRANLYLFLAQGEALAMDFLSLSPVNEAKTVNRVASIDEKLDGLRAVLHAWHGSIQDQDDLPASFKQGIRDLAQGRMVDMERALSEAPASRP